MEKKATLHRWQLREQYFANWTITYRRCTACGAEVMASTDESANERMGECHPPSSPPKIKRWAVCLTDFETKKPAQTSGVEKRT